jgi:hypothetical protein
VHKATLKAVDTVQVIPENTLVQKTVTLTIQTNIGPRHIVVTGLGDFAVTKQIRKQLARLLQLPQKTVLSGILNDPAYDSSSIYGLKAGIVTPFFIQGLDVIGICLLTTSVSIPAPYVALSIGQFESLQVESRYWLQLVEMFQVCGRTQIPIVILEKEGTV